MKTILLFLYLSYSVVHGQIVNEAVFLEDSLNNLSQMIQFPGLKKHEKPVAGVALASSYGWQSIINDAYINRARTYYGTIYTPVNFGNAPLRNTISWGELPVAKGTFGCMVGNLFSNKWQSNYLSSTDEHFWKSYEKIGSCALWYVPESWKTLQGLSLQLTGMSYKFHENGSTSKPQHTDINKNVAAIAADLRSLLKINSVFDASIHVGMTRNSNTNNEYVNYELYDLYNNPSRSGLLNDYLDFAEKFQIYGDSLEVLQDTSSPTLSNDSSVSTHAKASSNFDAVTSRYVLSTGLIANKRRSLGVKIVLSTRNSRIETGNKVVLTDHEFISGSSFLLHYADGTTFNYLRHSLCIGIIGYFETFMVMNYNRLYTAELQDKMKKYGTYSFTGTLQMPIQLHINLFNTPFAVTTRCVPEYYRHYSKFQFNRYNGIGIPYLSCGVRGSIGQNFTFSCNLPILENTYCSIAELQYHW